MNTMYKGQTFSVYAKAYSKGVLYGIGRVDARDESKVEWDFNDTLDAAKWACMSMDAEVSGNFKHTLDGIKLV